MNVCGAGMNSGEKEHEEEKEDLYDFLHRLFFVIAQIFVFTPPTRR